MRLNVGSRIDRTRVLSARRRTPGKETFISLLASGADPGCLSEILDSYFSPFHPSNNKKEEEKNFMGEKNCLSFFCSHTFYRIENYLFFLPGIE
jgi:hypothetical protein